MIVKCLASALQLRSLPVVNTGTETGRKMVKDQVAEVYGKSIDGKWFYLDAPAGRGWASGQYLTESAVQVHVSGAVAVNTSPAWPKVPNGRDEIERLFGSPGNPMCSAGRVHLKAPLKLSWSDEKVMVFSCHKLLEDVLQGVFDRLYDLGLWDAVETFGGCFECRNIKGSEHLSTHCWGISIDLDTDDNPLGSTSKKTMDPRIIAVFGDHGFLWGGNFTGRKDPMHFQYARGY